MKMISALILVFAFATSAFADLQPRPPGNPGNPNNPPPYPGDPGNGPGQPYPPQPPGYNDIYGPPRTVRWADVGSIKLQKFIETRANINVRGSFVNEVYFAAESNEVEIRSAWVVLSNGQAFEARNLIGTLRRGQQTRQLLDYRNSLRVDRIELRLASPNLIGSSATLRVQLGLAY